jgi:hypothetical protein
MKIRKGKEPLVLDEKEFKFFNDFFDGKRWRKYKTLRREKIYPVEKRLCKKPVKVTYEKNA